MGFLEDLKFLRDNRIIVKDKEVVDVVGISKGTVSSYLNGTKEPSANFLERFYGKYGKYLGETKVLKLQEPYERYTTKQNEEREAYKDKYIQQLEKTAKLQEELIREYEVKIKELTAKLQKASSG